MGVLDPLFHLFGWLIIERPARKKTLDDLIADLEATARTGQANLDAAADTPENREIARHVIGIERWGQRRLRVPLGEPAVHDEYDGYRPPENADIADLRAAFRETRKETLALAHRLIETDANGDTTVRHNQWGELSVRSWLYYLNFHAEKDLKGL